MSYSAVDLIKLIKKIAVEAVEAADPVDIVFGVVKKEAPLEIQVDQKLTLKAAQLILTRNVTDYEVEYTPQGGTRSTLTIHAALKVGDKVVMSMAKGGQKYLVLDRLVDE